MPDEIALNAKAAWVTCRPVLTDWQGNPVDVYVLGGRCSRFKALAEVLKAAGFRLEYCSDDDDAISMSKNPLKAYLSGPGIGNVAYKGLIDKVETLLYVSKNEDETFDVDVVIWPDVHFPESESSDVLLRRFGALFGFAVQLSDACMAFMVLLTDLDMQPRQEMIDRGIALWPRRLR